MQRSYFEPETIAEAVKILGEKGSRAGVVAGGTDLVVAHRAKKRLLPDSLVAIHRIKELAGLTQRSGGSLRLGALVTYSDLESSSLVRSRYTALADAASLVGSPATRHVGTLGGNLCNGSPAMELGGPLLVHDATVELGSLGGTRTIPLSKFLVGPGKTALAPSELLIAVHLVSLPQEALGSAYLRLEYRRAMEIAVVGATALIVVDDGGRLSSARIALTAVSPTCVRVPEAEALLQGQVPTNVLFAEAGRLAAEAASPIDDVRAPADYRRAMVSVMVARTLQMAVRRAEGEELPIPAGRAFG